MNTSNEKLLPTSKINDRGMPVKNGQKTPVHLRILFLTVVVLFLVGTFGFSYETYAASLSQKSVYIGYNNSDTVTLKGASGKIQWSSSNPKVAVISKVRSKTAVIQGKSVGTTTISAKCKGKTYKCIVHTWGFSISPSYGNGTIQVGVNCQFAVKGASLSKISSTNKSVATVSSKGVITGKKSGTCTLKYKIGKKNYSYRLKVVKPMLCLGNYTYSFGGGHKWNTSGYVSAGGSGSLSIKNSASGVSHKLCFRDINGWITSGITFSSSNSRVLSYDRMKKSWAYFNSYEDGTTTLTVKYKNQQYKFRITIQDSNTSTYKSRRNKIYQEAGIVSSMPDQYKCYLLAKWICDNAAYDYANYNNNTVSVGRCSSYKDYMKYGLIVCGGYADLYVYLCDGLGISCRTVDNKVGSHAWNIVKIDGQWYNVDVCWMDPGKNGQYQFQYFLVSDAKIKDSTHISDATIKATSNRFDNCTDEQLSVQNAALGCSYANIYSSLCNYSPWMTGTWTKY